MEIMKDYYNTNDYNTSVLEESQAGKSTVSS